MESTQYNSIKYFWLRNRILSC